MKKAALGLLIVICACGGLAGRGSAAQRKAEAAAVFSVQPVKSSFGEGEAMLLLLGLKNTGKQTIVADGRFALGRTIRVSVTGPGGKAVDWAASFNERVPSFQPLRPGNNITRVVCLNCSSRDPFRYPFRDAGTYTVRLEYAPSPSTAAERGGFPQAVALGQPVAAAPVELHVTPPTVRFTAQPAQPTCRVGEPVTFNFKLQNGSGQSVLAAYDLPLREAVWLKVVDASGKEVPWSGLASNVAPLLSTIDAGSAVEANYAITPENLFGKVTRGVDIRQPGTYTVYAVYELKQPIDELQAYVGTMPILLFPGPITAPPVKFTVQPAATPSPAKP